MEIEKDLSQKFIRYLKEHGYPEESIVCEWKVKNFRVDLAIIDIQTKKVMAIYEFKNYNYKNSDFAYNHILKALGEIGDYSIPAYIVFNDVNELGFVVKKLEVDRNSEKDIVVNIDYNIPNYKILQNSFDNGYVIQKTKEKENIKDKLGIISIFLAIIVVIILVLDILGKITMTTNRIILLGISIGLFLFPSIKSMKILGIEIEKKNNK